MEEQAGFYVRSLADIEFVGSLGVEDVDVMHFFKRVGCRNEKAPPTVRERLLAPQVGLEPTAYGLIPLGQAGPL